MAYSSLADAEKDDHLSTERTQTDALLIDLELSLTRAHQGISRWQENSLAMITNLQISSAESVLLRLIGLHGRPKSIKEIARQTNRQDIPNIQYSLRKLAGANLISKSGSGRSGVTYAVTSTGAHLLNLNETQRNDLLLSAMADMPDSGRMIKETVQFLTRLTDALNEAARAGTDRRLK